MKNPSSSSGSGPVGSGGPQRGLYFPSALAAGYHTLNRFVFLMTAADWWTGTSLCPTAYLLTTGVFQFPMMLSGTRGSGELDCLDPVSPDTGPSEPIKTSAASLCRTGSLSGH